jgi:hypothetical protein
VNPYNLVHVFVPLILHIVLIMTKLITCPAPKQTLDTMLTQTLIIIEKMEVNECSTCQYCVRIKYRQVSDIGHTFNLKCRCYICDYYSKYLWNLYFEWKSLWIVVDCLVLYKKNYFSFGKGTWNVIIVMYCNKYQYVIPMNYDLANFE